MMDTQPIRLPDVARFTAGGVTVTPAARTISGVRELVIEPRVMQVLIALHHHCGEVVGREALVGACWDRRTVGEDAVNRAILKLRRALDEIGGALTVETIAKVGYRLCTGQVAGEIEPASADEVRPGGSRRPRLAAAIAAAAVAMASLLAGSLHRSGPQGSAATNRVVMVQPLRVVSADAPARRLAQDFASDLSRAVLGHDNRLEFADGQAATGRTAAFTVAGSVASIGKNLHAVVLITKRDSPSILWSHDYTSPIDDIDGLRQQVGTNVAAVLVCALGTDGIPDQINIQSVALYLETCNLHSGDHRREADLLRQVLAHAPRFAGGWADLAISLALLSFDPATADVASIRRESRASAMHALALDPHLGRAFFARALLLPGVKNWTARERLMAMGLAAQPDCPQLYNIRASDLAAIGRQQDSIANNRRSVELDPLFPGKYASLVRALADAGRLDAANDVIRHMQQTWPDNHYTWEARFETAARIGDPREAEAMLEDTRARFLDAGNAATWRTILEARERPTADQVRRAIAALADERRRGAASDAQFVEGLALLGRPGMALEQALHMPPQPESAFWFRSFLQPLRGDRRFITVAKQQGLYRLWSETGLWPDFCTDASVRYRCQDAVPATIPSPTPARL